MNQDSNKGIKSRRKNLWKVLTIMWLAAGALTSFYWYQSNYDEYTAGQRTISQEQRELNQKVLRAYAEKFERQDPQKAKHFYAQQGITNAGDVLARRIESRLFLITDKFGNIHPLSTTPSSTRYDLFLQRKLGNENAVIYLRDCDWLENESWQHEQKWIKENCRNANIKFDGSYLQTLLRTEESRIARLQEQAKRQEQKRIITESFVIFLVFSFASGIIWIFLLLRKRSTISKTTGVL